MNGFRRYGIYMLPEGALFAEGSAWLGWDSVEGKALAHPAIPGLPQAPETLTVTPRKYGLHGTIKPPFRLAEGMTAKGLAKAAAAFCGTAASVMIPRMEVRRLGGFVAIVPSVPCKPLADLAGAAVRALDPFRASPDAAELARRRKHFLSPRQEQLLARWGYPYVMEEFRFHITLTGALDPTIAEGVENALASYFDPFLANPVPIHDLALMGEDENGFFHLIHRCTLSG